MKILKTKKYTILSNILKYSFIIVFAFMLFAPVIFASDVSVTIDNPLGKNGPQTVVGYINAVINILLKFAVPVVTLAIIYTGFLFVEARGKPEKITTAKKALTYTLIGAALLLGALVVATAIKATVEALGAGV
jgi:hypothetical protein